jgi:hypothetical protein
MGSPPSRTIPTATPTMASQRLQLSRRAALKRPTLGGEGSIRAERSTIYLGWVVPRVSDLPDTSSGGSPDSPHNRHLVRHFWVRKMGPADQRP